LAKTGFSAVILAWYEEHKRSLPWREGRNPYFIWLSEIILQQTRVSQGLPYYNRFISHYPTVKALAEAPIDEVLRIWQGLGYYSRARNLHKCAKIIIEEYNGVFPDKFEELQKLPGIGRYTAAAIASVAYNQPVAVVDGNVYRLLARYFGIETDITSTKAYGEFYELAMQNLEHAQPGNYNQAMMEFGAVQCKPKTPDCYDCVLGATCFAKQHGTQDKLPVKSRKTKVRDRYFNYFLIRSGQKILMQQRSANDIWRGLYEFPLVETKSMKSQDEIDHQLLKQLNKWHVVYLVEDKIHRHVLSHQILHVNFVVIEIDHRLKESLQIEKYKWFSLQEAEVLPKPVLIANYLDSYTNSIHLQ